MDKQPVGQLPDLASSNNDDEIMVITNSEYNQLKKEKISDLITDFTSTNENNALTKGTDGKMFVTDFGNASNITEGTLPTSVLPEIPLEKIPDIPKDKLPQIEIADLPVSGVTADTYAYPSSVTVNAQGQVTEIVEGAPGANNANQDLSNLSPEGEKHFLNKTQITNCILEAPNGVAEWSGVSPTGSLTNNQGVVSGFSASNYLTINKIPETVNSFEMVWCVTTGDLTNSFQVVTGQPRNHTTPQLQIDEDEGNSSGKKSGRFCFGCGTSNNAWGSWIYAINKPLAYTTYWLKTIWDGTTIYFYLKTSKEAAWELQGTIQQSYVEWSDIIGIGIDSIDVGDAYKIWQGSIDLSQSYIKINGEMWWQGNDLGFNQFRVKQGLKTLIPNGRNEDRTLKNIENTVTQDLTFTHPDNATGSYWAAVGTSATRLRKTSWEYKNDENYIIGTLENGNLGQKAFATMIGDMEAKNGNIVSFTPYNPVSLATKDDVEDIKSEIEDIKKEYGTAYIIETYLNGGSGYIVYSNGYCEQWGLTNARAGSSITINYIKTFKDTNYFIAVTSRNKQNDTGGYQSVKIGVSGNSPYDFGLSVTGFRASTANEAETKYAWKVSGYLASGEY